MTVKLLSIQNQETYIIQSSKLEINQTPDTGKTVIFDGINTKADVNIYINIKIHLIKE